MATPLGMADEMLIGTADRLHRKIAPLCETSRFWLVVMVVVVVMLVVVMMVLMAVVIVMVMV